LIYRVLFYGVNLVIIVNIQHLTGKFLLSTPLLDQRGGGLAHAVIYLYAEEGGIIQGFVINKALPTGHDVLIKAMGKPEAANPAHDRLYLGGNISSTRLGVLYQQGGRLQYACTRDRLSRIFHSEQRYEAKFILGYVSWTEAELYDEIAAHQWLVAPAQVSHIFADNDHDIRALIQQEMGLGEAVLTAVAGKT
jgi:putative AlgH/UPF0301 family transcriptional regulator